MVDQELKPIGTAGYKGLGENTERITEILPKLVHRRTS